VSRETPGSVTAFLAARAGNRAICTGLKELLARQGEKANEDSGGPSEYLSLISAMNFATAPILPRPAMSALRRGVMLFERGKGEKDEKKY